MLLVGQQEFDRLAGGENWPVLFQEAAWHPTGPEALYAVDTSGIALKMRLVELENTHPLGRVWDFDPIIARHGGLSRQDLGYLARRCLEHLGTVFGRQLLGELALFGLLLLAELGRGRIAALDRHAHCQEELVLPGRRADAEHVDGLARPIDELVRRVGGDVDARRRLHRLRLPAAWTASVTLRQPST